MPGFLQFRCPVCAIMLRLPLEKSGDSGNCPACQSHIEAPNAQTGAPARRIAAHSAAIAPPTARCNRASGPCRFRPALFFLLLPVLVITLFGAYLLGRHHVTSVSPPASPIIFPEQPGASPPVPDFSSAASLPAADSLPATPEFQTAAATAEIALRAFLAAPDWARRSSYVLDPARVRPAMKSHAQLHGDSPTPITGLVLHSGRTDPATGKSLLLFHLTNPAHPAGFPIAIHETPDGWQVDWETFIEFRDDLFKHFTQAPADTTGRFHLQVTLPETTNSPDNTNPHFSVFLLNPPMPGREQLAYCRKPSPAHAQLTKSIRLRGIAVPVLEVAKRKTPDGRTFFEIINLIATDWIPVKHDE